MPPKCTIILPTYNRMKYLPKSLEAIFNLDYPDFEIIVVNDGSIDGTKKYLDDLKNPHLRIFHNETNKGLSFSKNRGAQIAQTNYIAFTDDDCVVKNDWLKKLIEGFTTSDIFFVFGQTFYIKENYRGYFPERMVQNLGARWPAGGNIMYRRELFEKIGYFNPFFDYYHNEDSDLAIRAANAGLKFKRTTQAVIYHQPMNWTVKSLLASAHNDAVWPIFKKRYSKAYQTFGPPIKFNFIVQPQDYLYIIALPILLPVLLLRYFWHKKSDLKLFFAKWPLYLFLRRFYIIREAIKNHVFII